ncbi:MAG: hypothetical protein M1826_001457 [Phylliscum demangeonii]|nr:MAG: hypothetical protein M1826_001457 [Phylliscum demangeonii]
MFPMNLFDAVEYDPEKDATQNQRNLYTQLIISLVLGLTAFISFCILRPRWATLYAARKQQISAAASLPDLPDTFFGWIPVLYRITEQQVLDSAGLDAFVFLAFFRLAVRFLTVAFLAALVILLPIQYHFRKDAPSGPGDGGDKNDTESAYPRTRLYRIDSVRLSDLSGFSPDDRGYPPGYFWMYTVFVYFFTGLIFYLLNAETKKIIKVRQDYLGSQTTTTDRTIRLAGIPPELRSEGALARFIEKLGIGKVESVTICRDWSELDQLMEIRGKTLRKLETAWIVNSAKPDPERSGETVRPAPLDGFAEPETDEESQLLPNENGHDETTTPRLVRRPTTRIRYGFFNLQSKEVDAIAYYEERLRRLDDKINAVRRKELTSMPLAFVTMDSIATCQMAVQAVLDPSPLRLMAHLAPAPSAVVWRNTYLPRSHRMARAWIITMFVGILTVFWSVLLVPLAGLLEISSIRKVFPGLGEVLDAHKVLKSLVQTSLPTLGVSLLTVAVPYLYDWLSNMQGMISQADVELSVISKNFFFTFINLFLFYTLLGSATTVLTIIKDSLSDTRHIANLLATQLEHFGQFYINLIILQGLGLFPFRLLEFGSVSLYPIYLFAAKTPRDYAELNRPPVFKYGFFLPQSLLIFIICIVYSVIPNGVWMLLFGLFYFLIGYFIYKYQLLYAMDHDPHSTGQAWPIISYRTILGVGVFQLAMFGWLALKRAIKPSAFVLPLLVGTIWFSYFYSRTYEPLTKFIALGSIRRQSARPRASIRNLVENVWRDEPNDGGDGAEEEEEEGDASGDHSAADENRRREPGFTNPNLTSPLNGPWLSKDQADHARRRGWPRLPDDEGESGDEQV